MTKEPQAPAEIMAQHALGRRHYCCGLWVERKNRPCLPYVLADALAAERRQVDRLVEKIGKLTRENTERYLASADLDYPSMTKESV